MEGLEGAKPKRRRRKKQPQKGMNGVDGIALKRGDLSSRAKIFAEVSAGVVIGGVMVSLAKNMVNPNNETNGKAYIAPILTAGMGLAGYMLVDNEDVQNVALGVAANGAVQTVSVAMKGRDAFRLDMKGGMNGLDAPQQYYPLLGLGEAQDVDDIVRYLTETDDEGEEQDGQRYLEEGGEMEGFEGGEDYEEDDYEESDYEEGDYEEYADEGELEGWYGDESPTNGNSSQSVLLNII